MSCLSISAIQVNKDIWGSSLWSVRSVPCGDLEGICFSSLVAMFRSDQSSHHLLNYQSQLLLIQSIWVVVLSGCSGWGLNSQEVANSPPTSLKQCYGFAIFSGMFVGASSLIPWLAWTTGLLCSIFGCAHYLLARLIHLHLSSPNHCQSCTLYDAVNNHCKHWCV